MGNYSVLLVDDEEEVFQVMMKKIDWEALGFQVAGYAKNGMEALDMAETLQPDVVMTDVKMPYMDGLTLCRKLKEMYENVKVIIFSGFDEFEYAKEAIKIEAEEYILKPINANELREVFERVKINLDKELDERRNIDKLRRYYQESLPVLQDGFYTALLDGRMSEKQIVQYAANYQIDLTGAYYVVSVLHISSNHDAGTQQRELDPLLQTVSVKNLADEHLADRWKARTVLYLGDIILISQLEGPDELFAFTDSMDKFCKMAARVCNAVTTAGIGHVCSEIGQLQISYQGAQNAMAYRVLYGNGRAISIAEIEPQEGTEDTHWEENAIRDILKSVKMGEPEDLRQTVASFIQKIRTARNSLEQYRILLMELVAELYRFTNDNHWKTEEIFDGNDDVYEHLLHLETPQLLEAWLYDKCALMQEKITNDRQDSTKSFVTKAMEYAREQYADKDLSTESLCRALNVSAAYFSTVFKKETGRTFMNYLTDYRMEKAVDLLIKKNEKTYIIAEKVGYGDANYFSYVFKKQYGMSPSKYKQEKTADNEEALE